MAFKEIRKIPGLPNYGATADGRIYRLTYKSKYCYKEKITEKKQTLDSHGYYVVNISENGKSRPYHVHVLVLFAFVGLRPGKNYTAAHLNGKKTDNAIENLMWATYKENMSHKRIHGTLLYGEKHHNSKLKNADIPKIRYLLFCGEKQRDIAKMFNVSQRTILRIKQGKCYNLVH